ncbi:hypothetical protein STEG23_029484 [Scotinomys teguina]
MLGVLCCDFYITLDEYVFKFTFLIGRPSVRERKLLHPKAFVDLQLRILHFTSIEPHRSVYPASNGILLKNFVFSMTVLELYISDKNTCSNAIRIGVGGLLGLGLASRCGSPYSPPSVTGFPKMDAKNPKTLLDLSIQSLLRNESALIQALEDIPRDVFVPLFIAAFQGGHKNKVIEMVKVWPFYCLHIGSLTVEEPQHEVMKAMIENFPGFIQDPAGKMAGETPELTLEQPPQDASTKKLSECLSLIGDDLDSIMKLKKIIDDMNMDPPHTQGHLLCGN